MMDRPILFSAPMVRALIQGRKTQTRRIIKNRGELPDFCGGKGDSHNDPESYGWEDFDRGSWITLDQFRHWNFVPFAIGDRLWVREAFFGGHLGCSNVTYRADQIHAMRAIPWRPSIHMPRCASRITLTVTDVRVQRLQDISEADAISEGIHQFDDGWHFERNPEPAYMRLVGIDPIKMFSVLWRSINGPDAWDANPWVAALTFDVAMRNIDEVPA